MLTENQLSLPLQQHINIHFFYRPDALPLAQPTARHKQKQEAQLSLTNRTARPISANAMAWLTSKNTAFPICYQAEFAEM